MITEAVKVGLILEICYLDLAIFQALKTRGDLDIVYTKDRKAQANKQ
jgi:hypothetical protein